MVRDEHQMLLSKKRPKKNRPKKKSLHICTEHPVHLKLEKYTTFEIQGQVEAHGFGKSRALLLFRHSRIEYESCSSHM